MENIVIKPLIKPLGDSAVTLEWPSDISPEINLLVRESARKIDSAKIYGIIEIVPAYRTLTIFYSPFDISYEQLHDRVILIDFSSEKTRKTEKNIVRIPVVYGGEYGADLAYAAEFCKMSIDDFIILHSSPEYFVYMIGFMPGFPYLGGLDERLYIPRLQKPRVTVPQGSVAIGGVMTGIYPLKSPGGWHIIGRTPLKLFDKKNESKPFLLKAGDYIKFVPIEERSFTDYD